MKVRAKRSIIWSMPQEQFADLVSKSYTIGAILKEFGLENKGGNSNTVQRRIKEENIDISHISLGIGCNKNKKFPNKKRMTTNEQLFVENCIQTRSVVRNRIIKDKLIEYKCQECGLPPEWNNKPLSLQLEHKNGISNDNRLENLCFLCANCHSQTGTYAGKNKRIKS